MTKKSWRNVSLLLVVVSELLTNDCMILPTESVLEHIFPLSDIKSAKCYHDINYYLSEAKCVTAVESPATLSIYT